MIPERFSKREFDARGRGSDDAKQLAGELAEAMSRELQGALESAVQQLVDRLNEVGHDLKVESIDLGNVGYGDYSEAGPTRNYNLQFAADLHVGCGYPDFADAAEDD